MNQPGFVQSGYGFCQCVVIRIPFAANQRFDNGLIQALDLTEADVLGPPIRMVNQIISSRLTIKQRLLKCIQHKVRLHEAANPAAHNAACVNINHKGHEKPALPRSEVPEVLYPQLVGPVSLENAVDPVQWTRCISVWSRGPQGLTPEYTLQTKRSHQSLNRIKSHTYAFTVH